MEDPIGSIDFLKPTEQKLEKARKTSWTVKNTLQQLDHFENWLIEEPENIYWIDYVRHLKKSGILINPHWFWDIRARFEESEKTGANEVLARYKKIRAVIEHKKIQMAQRGKLQAAPVIFELKAKHGWRDGSEGNKNPQIALNLAIQGLSLPDLQKKIDRLASKGNMADRLERIQTKKAEFSVISD